MIKTVKKYYAVWLITAANSLQETFLNRATNMLFLLGKFIRLGISLLFLFIIRQQITELAGYSRDEIVIVYLVYLLIDTIAQALFRGTYTFQQLVRNGRFDFYLSKPVSPLFRSLMGKPDINDVIFLIPTVVIGLYIASTLSIEYTFPSFFFFCLLLVNSLLLAVAFHIFVLAIGIITAEVGGVIALYRDLTRLSMVPAHIYREPVRLILFTIIPIGVMNTIPADVLLGKGNFFTVIAASIFGWGFLGMNVLFWRWALKQYSSASS